MKKSLIIIVSLIVVVGVIGGGVWYWQKNKVVNQVVTNSQQVISTNQGVSQSSTSTLLTYKNSKYGYEFQYPKSWDNIVANDDEAFTLLFNNDQSASLYAKDGGTPEFYSSDKNFAAIQTSMYQEGVIVGNSRTVVNKSTDLKQFLLQQMLCTPARLKEIILGGVNAFQCAYTNSGFDIGTVWVKIGGNILSINVESGVNYKNYQDLGSAFNTVVSTFKFTK